MNPRQLIKVGKPKNKITVGLAASHLIMIGYCLLACYPVAWAFSSALKSNSTLFDDIFALFTEFHWENFVEAWNRANISKYFFNSVFITGGGLITLVFLASMTSYALTRVEFKGRKAVNFLYISGIMTPGLCGLVPLYVMLVQLKLVDNHLMLILIQVANMFPFTIFLLTNFYRTVPLEISEAAIIDGCSHYQLFTRIMFPLTRVGLMPILIIQFMNSWNEFYWSMILIMSEEKKTLQYGLYALQKVTMQKANWVVMFAAAVIIMLPCLVMYIIFQKHIVEGVNMGAVKG